MRSAVPSRRDLHTAVAATAISTVLGCTPLLGPDFISLPLLGPDTDTDTLRPMRTQASATKYTLPLASFKLALAKVSSSALLPLAQARCV